MSLNVFLNTGSLGIGLPYSSYPFVKDVFPMQNSVQWTVDFVPEVVAHSYTRDERTNGRSIVARLTLNM
jgi:hypothetical protein